MLMPDLTAMQLHEAATLLTQGWTQKSLALRYGVSEPTLCRRLAKLKDSGDAEAAVAKNYATGPRDDHALTPDEIAVLKLGMLTKRSRRLAADLLLRSDCCTAETHAKLAAVFDGAAEKRTDEVWPRWFMRACILTDEERAAFHGPKALAAVEPARPRGLIYKDESGASQPLFANALWEFDDESENTPWLEIDEDGRPRVNRQTLKAIDVYSSFYLGMRAVSRDSDGYRIEDQADFLLELIDAHGLPLRARIERGPWDNNFWFGSPLPKAWWHTPECASLRWGGIDISAGGPIGVMQAFKSRQKGTIEGSFNHRQNLAAHETLDIGRERGEHEANARLHRLALNGNVSAIAKFPTAAARADISADVLDRFNHEAKRRPHLFGAKKVVPAELFSSAVRRDLPAEHRWRFLPVKAAVTVRNAHVSLRAKGYELPFLFTAEGFAPQWDWNAWLPHGWRVLAAFHPARPDLGCHVFNGLHPDHPQNPRRFPIGLPLGILPHAAHAPQWSDAPETADFDGRRKTQSAVRAETRIIKAAKKHVRVSSVVSRGQVRTIRKGSADPLLRLAASEGDALAPLNLDSGAPPVGGQTSVFADESLERGGDLRSAADPRAGIGEADRGRPGQTAAYATAHGPTRHAQDHSRSAALAALEALEALEASLE
jgi:hypothetical protein